MYIFIKDMNQSNINRTHFSLRSLKNWKTHIHLFKIKDLLLFLCVIVKVRKVNAYYN